jgi:hypothetical protein
MFRAPFVKSLAQKRGGHNEGDREKSVPSKTFSEKFGKSIDGANCECSLKHLSPKKGAVL